MLFNLLLVSWGKKWKLESNAIIMRLRVKCCSFRGETHDKEKVMPGGASKYITLRWLLSAIFILVDKNVK